MEHFFYESTNAKCDETKEFNISTVSSKNLTFYTYYLIGYCEEVNIYDSCFQGQPRKITEAEILIVVVTARISDLLYL